MILPAKIRDALVRNLDPMIGHDGARCLLLIRIGKTAQGVKRESENLIANPGLIG
jgi:hypothetical protein